MEYSKEITKDNNVKISLPTTRATSDLMILSPSAIKITAPLRQNNSDRNLDHHRQNTPPSISNPSGARSRVASDGVSNFDTNLFNNSKPTISELRGKSWSVTARSHKEQHDNNNNANASMRDDREEKAAMADNQQEPPLLYDDTHSSTLCIQTEPQRQPLHEVSCGEEEDMDFLGHRRSRSLLGGQQRRDVPPIDMSKSSKRPRLTLSAFCRPEQTVRVTDCDPTRRIAAEYDFHAPECRVLGHGASSTVRLAVRRRDGVKVAVKRIEKHEALRSRRLRRHNRRHLDEWEILQRLNGDPYIVNLIDLFETNEDIQVVMEFCKGGELYDAIQRKRKNNMISSSSSSSSMSRHHGTYNEKQAARITKQMLTALADLHSRGIVHRDVKPENILLVDDDESNIRVKLSDFGLARVLAPDDECCDSSSDSSSCDGESSPFTPRSRAYSNVGTNYYVAPEVCAGEGYDATVDVYSLGVTLYILLCGSPPSFSTDFDTSNSSEDSDDEVVVFPSEQWEDVSESSKQLIRKMLEVDPTKRITAADALQHPWVVENSQPDKVVLEHALYFAPAIAPRPAIDLELVCSKLYKTIDRKRTSNDPSYEKSRSKKKRSKLERGSSTRRQASTPSLTSAMVDLHRVVASAAASATAAAAGVIVQKNGNVSVSTE